MKEQRPSLQELVDITQTLQDGISAADEAIKCGAQNAIPTPEIDANTPPEEVLSILSDLGMRRGQYVNELQTVVIPDLYNLKKRRREQEQEAVGREQAKYQSLMELSKLGLFSEEELGKMSDALDAVPEQYRNAIRNGTQEEPKPGLFSRLFNRSEAIEKLPREVTVPEDFESVLHHPNPNYRDMFFETHQGTSHAEEAEETRTAQTAEPISPTENPENNSDSEFPSPLSLRLAGNEKDLYEALVRLHKKGVTKMTRADIVEELFGEEIASGRLDASKARGRVGNYLRTIRETLSHDAPVTVDMTGMKASARYSLRKNTDIEETTTREPSPPLDTQSTLGNDEIEVHNPDNKSQEVLPNVEFQVEGTDQEEIYKILAYGFAEKRKLSREVIIHRVYGERIRNGELSEEEGKKRFTSTLNSLKSRISQQDITLESDRRRGDPLYWIAYEKTEQGEHEEQEKTGHKTTEDAPTESSREFEFQIDIDLIGTVRQSSAYPYIHVDELSRIFTSELHYLNVNTEKLLGLIQEFNTRWSDKGITLEAKSIGRDNPNYVRVVIEDGALLDRFLEACDQNADRQNGQNDATDVLVNNSSNQTTGESTEGASQEPQMNDEPGLTHISHGEGQTPTSPERVEEAADNPDTAAENRITLDEKYRAFFEKVEEFVSKGEQLDLESIARLRYPDKARVKHSDIVSARVYLAEINMILSTRNLPEMFTIEGNKVSLNLPEGTGAVHDLIEFGKRQEPRSGEAQEILIADIPDSNGSVPTNIVPVESRPDETNDRPIPIHEAFDLIREEKDEQPLPKYDVDYDSRQVIAEDGRVIGFDGVAWQIFLRLAQNPNTELSDKQLAGLDEMMRDRKTIENAITIFRNMRVRFGDNIQDPKILVERKSGNYLFFKLAAEINILPIQENV